MKILLSCFLMLFFSEITMAVDADKAVIFFANGVNNTTDDAIASLNSIRAQLGSSIGGKTIEYKLAFNPTENVLLDVVEAYQQLIDSGQISGPPNKIWTGLLWIIGLGTENPAVLITAAANQTLLNQLAKAQVVSSSVIDQHANLYRKVIRDDKGVVLIVAHSQGNLYANAAWSRLYSDNLWLYNQNQFRSLGLLSVATPANGVGYALAEPEDRGLVTRYVTLSDDKVISVARLLSGALPANTNNSITPVNIDHLHHGFVEAYLAGSDSRSMITQAAQQIASQLQPAYRTAETQSSAIRQAGYNPNTKELDIGFLSNGSVYRYLSAPDNIYDNLIAAESVGGYYNAHIRGKYVSQKLK